MPGKDIERCPGRLDHHSFISPKVRRAHEVLGVKMGAPPEQVTSAYRKLARLTHPDHNPDRPDAARAFERVQEAYSIVTDPDRIHDLNLDYLQSISGRLTIGGRTFDAGSFYGVRRFTRSGVAREKLQKLLPGGNGTPVKGSPKKRPEEHDRRAYIEEESSILDLPEWDMIEILLGGEFRREDSLIAERTFHEGGLEALEQTPWVLRNLDGYRHFMAGDFLTSAEIYKELNDRIPSNMIFLYREGLSLEAWACHRIRHQNETTRSLRGVFHRALDRYTEALEVGEERPAGEQQFAISIRKAYADLCEAIGYRHKARRSWHDLLEIKPRSIEGQEKEQRLTPLRFYLRKAGDLLTGNR